MYKTTLITDLKIFIQTHVSNNFDYIS